MADTSGAASIGEGSGKSESKQLRRYSDVLYEQFIPLHPRYAIGLDILAADVQFGHFHAQTGQTIQGFFLVVTVRGALLGYQHNLTNQSLIGGHVPPTEREAINILTSCCTQLREAKAQQGNTNGSPFSQNFPPGLPKDFS